MYSTQDYDNYTLRMLRLSDIIKFYSNSLVLFVLALPRVMLCVFASHLIRSCTYYKPPASYLYDFVLKLATLSTPLHLLLHRIVFPDSCSKSSVFSADRPSEKLTIYPIHQHKFISKLIFIYKINNIFIKITFSIF